MFDRMHDEIIILKEEMIALRRDFHQHLEPSMQEKRTAQVISDRLSDLGLQVKGCVGKTGVVGLLDGKGPGKTLLLRADMDALPIQEENDVSYCSRNGVPCTLVATMPISRHNEACDDMMRPSMIIGSRFLRTLD